MTTSGFLYRDILKYVIPTLLIFVLFFPIYNEGYDSKTIIAFGIVISLIIGPVINLISKKVTNYYPGMKSFYDIIDFNNMHWDLDKIFYYQTKEKRDYLYLTAAYAEFYRTTALIIAIYFFHLLYKWLSSALPAENFIQVIKHKSLLIGGLEANTLFVLIVCFVTVIYLISAMKTEFKILFLPNGQYDFFAEQIQREEQKVIAKYIYGTISNSSGGLIGNEIELFSNGEKLASCMSIEKGYWHIPLKKSYINRKLELRFTISQKTYTENIEISYNNRSYFELTF